MTPAPETWLLHAISALLLALVTDSAAWQAITLVGLAVSWFVSRQVEIERAREAA